MTELVIHIRSESIMGKLLNVAEQQNRSVEDVLETILDNYTAVDCCIVALAERLNITQVCTFDRSDFSMVRPKHCEYLELLP